MHDPDYMIRMLQDFLSEEREELVFLSLLEKIPDFIEREAFFEAQIQVKEEMGFNYVKMWQGDPRFGKEKHAQIKTDIAPQNAVAVKHLASERNMKVTTLVRRLLHGFMRANGIEPYYAPNRKRYEENSNIEVKKVDLDALADRQFEEGKNHPDFHAEPEAQKNEGDGVNFRWYSRRNAIKFR